ncbi:MAG TPA: CvpA family protein [Bryobacteraceae bacterium]|nr:CvpA family protein [Bryobacteraceae bacterium]
MNWLDVVLLILVLGSVVSAFRKGFSRELVGFGAAIVGLVLGSWFYGTAGSYLLDLVSSRVLANFIGFVLVFGGVLLAGTLIGRILNYFIKAVGLSIFDRLLGAGFGLLRGALLAIALVMAMMAFSSGGKAPSAVLRSRLSPYVLDAAGVCASMAPFELKQGFRSSYKQAKAVWGGTVGKGNVEKGVK